MKPKNINKGGKMATHKTIGDVINERANEIIKIAEKDGETGTLAEILKDKKYNDAAQVALFYLTDEKMNIFKSNMVIEKVKAHFKIK